jgi:protein-tyrosine phosphatase
MFNLFKKKPKVDADLSFIGIDMHSHLLPGIDDGSPDLAHSLLYIEELHKLGYKKFICTPHIIMDMYPNNRDTIMNALDKVRAGLKERQIDVEVDAAAEYMVNPDFEPLLKAGNLLTIHKKYILIEMSYMAPAPNIKEIVFELRMQGLTPILAHPERYNYYHNKFDMYHQFVEMGCLLQVNILSLSGMYGKHIKKAADELLKHNMISFAGTDLHHEKHLAFMQQMAKENLIYESLQNKPLMNSSLM